MRLKNRNTLRRKINVKNTHKSNTTPRSISVCVTRPVSGLVRFDSWPSRNKFSGMYYESTLTYRCGGSIGIVFTLTYFPVSMFS